MRQLALIVLFVLAALPAWAQPRIQSTDMHYEGKFNVPWDCGNYFFGYGGGGLAIGPKGDTLYVAAFDGSRAIGEISIPAMGGTAKVVTPCTYPMGIDTVSDNTLVGGLLYWPGPSGNKIIVSGYNPYDAPGSVVKSHGGLRVISPTSFEWIPYTQVGTLGGGYVGGYMGHIPAEWQAAFGGKAATGQCCLSIISRTSSGPSFHVFNPDDVGKSFAPITTLLNYPLSTPLQATISGVANSLFQRMDPIGGFAFPSGTSSVLFVGAHYGGQHCYGEAHECAAVQSHPYKGDHASPSVYRVWAYDANELVAVKSGQKKPWDPRPYTTWELPDIGKDGKAHLRNGGAAYDPVNRKLYIAAPQWNERMEIHRYRIGAPTGGPDPTPTETFTWTVPATTTTTPAQTITVPGQTVTVPAKIYTCTKPAGGVWSCK